MRAQGLLPQWLLVDVDVDVSRAAADDPSIRSAAATQGSRINSAQGDRGGGGNKGQLEKDCPWRCT